MLHDVEDPTCVIYNFGVVPALRDDLVEHGHSRDFGGEVAVEVIPVDGSAQQPRSDGRVIVHVPAQRIHRMDPTPGGYPFRKPEQCLDTAWQAVQGPHRQRAEGVR
ncbi:hypothetical protein, partial [Streptomyces sp. NPDC005009]